MLQKQASKYKDLFKELEAEASQMKEQLQRVGFHFLAFSASASRSSLMVEWRCCGQIPQLEEQVAEHERIAEEKEEEMESLREEFAKDLEVFRQEQEKVSSPSGACCASSLPRYP